MRNSTYCLLVVLAFGVLANAGTIQSLPAEPSAVFLANHNLTVTAMDGTVDLPAVSNPEVVPGFQRDTICPEGCAGVFGTIVGADGACEMCDVPEPASLTLVSIGLAALLLARRSIRL